MAALDFPNNPATGDLYGSSGTVWRWDGSVWNSTAGASGARGTVAFAKVTVSQGGITGAMTDIAGLSVTWTANPTRTYRTSVISTVSSSVVGDFPTVNIRDAAGNNIANDGSYLNTISAGAGLAPWVVETGLSGVQTRKVSLLRALGSGTLNFYAVPTQPAQILVEDITYEAGTSGVGIEPTAWVPLTFGANWSNLGAPFQTCQYRRVGDIVTLRGLATSSGTGFIIGTLPAGFTPPSQAIFTCATSQGTTAGGTIRVDVQTNGQINLGQGAAAGMWATLSGISFSLTP